jgi:hypothetical protein
MHRLGAVIGIAIVGAALSTPSQAREIRTFPFAGWTVGAYSDDVTGQFSHCTGHAEYQNSVSLIFTVTRYYQWNVAFFSPRFNVKAGQTIDIGLSVDGRMPTKVPSLAITNKAVKVDLSPDGPIVNLFRQGSRLTLTANDAQLEFNLTNTSKLIPALVQCVHAALNPAPLAARSSNFAPIAAAPSPATPAPSIDASNRRAEAVAIVANVLAASGLTGFRILDESEDQNNHNRVAWTAGHIFGTLAITDEGDNADTVIGIFIGMDAATCPGKFASGKLPNEQSGERHAFVLCEDPKNSLSKFYLTFPRAKGGNYIFTVEGSQDEASKTDTQLKPVIQRAVFAH